ncbi:MAG: metallophosphoesterase [Prevotellaceae bacterium]|jgi:predicted MPP superfamily phosphohydrolase|nr:metallophosphoesterase [Prevotellaceae bacterium]
MKDIVVLSLSDIHMREQGKDEKSERIRATFINGIGKFVRENAKWHPDYICISGDIAYSGKSCQYDEVEVYIEKMLKKLDIDKDRVMMVAGNHDLNAPVPPKFPKDEAEWEKYTEYVKSYEKEVNEFFNGTGKVPGKLKETYENYSNFRGKYLTQSGADSYCYYESIDLFKDSIPYLTGYKVFKDSRVVFVELNNSWRYLPESKEIIKNGRVRFEERVFRKLKEKIKNLKKENYTIISLFHHPLYMLDPLEYQSAGKDYCLYDDLVSLSDLCFAGHTHGPEGKTPDCLGNQCQYILNGAFYDKNPDTQAKVAGKQTGNPVADCSATLLRIDAVNNTLERKHICYDSRREGWIFIDMDTIPLYYHFTKTTKSASAKEDINLKYKLIEMKNYAADDEAGKERLENQLIVKKLFGDSGDSKMKDSICFVDMRGELETAIKYLNNCLDKHKERKESVPLIVSCKASDWLSGCPEKNYIELKKHFQNHILRGKMYVFLCRIKKG